jgi:hypothetical protein
MLWRVKHALLLLVLADSIRDKDDVATEEDIMVGYVSFGLCCRSNGAVAMQGTTE